MRSLVKETPSGKWKGNLHKAQANTLFGLAAALCSAQLSLLETGEGFRQTAGKKSRVKPRDWGSWTKGRHKNGSAPLQGRIALCPALPHLP